jgi:alkylhydroperoxidase family enzyme
MPRVPLIATDSLDPDDRARLAALTTADAPGAGSAVFQAMAHRPAIMRTALAHLEALMREGVVAPALKALVAVRVAQVNHCVY